jgi:hypothetical protein
MSQVVIENPIINSPFEEPTRHFRFDEQGITNQIVVERRISQYFVPIAKPRNTAKERQLTFEEWTEDRIEENKTVIAMRDTYKTQPDKSHVSHVVGDTKSWEQKMAQTLWIPAVNNAGTWGRWPFVEIRDPWNAKIEILSKRNG